MKIAKYFLINIFMDLYYIYLKQGTFVGGSEMCDYYYLFIIILYYYLFIIIFVYGFILH